MTPLPRNAGDQQSPLPSSPLTAAPERTAAPGTAGAPAADGAGNGHLYNSGPGACGTDLLPVDTTSLTPKQKEVAKRLSRRTDPSYRKRREEVAREIEEGKWPGYTPDTAWHLDHIVAIDRLARIPGFVDLPAATQEEIASSAENTRPLRDSWNTSKRQRSYSQWPTNERTGRLDAPDKDTWEALCEEERVATSKVIERIAAAYGETDPVETTNGPASNSPTRMVTPTQETSVTVAPLEPTYEPTDPVTETPTEYPTTEVQTEYPTTEVTTPEAPQELPSTEVPPASTQPPATIPRPTTTDTPTTTWTPPAIVGQTGTVAEPESNWDKVKEPLIVTGVVVGVGAVCAATAGSGCAVGVGAGVGALAATS